MWNKIYLMTNSFWKFYEVNFYSDWLWPYCEDVYLYKVFCKMSIITVGSVFFFGLLDLILRETAFCVDTKIVTAFLPGFHETVLHDEAVIEPLRPPFYLRSSYFTDRFSPELRLLLKNRKIKLLKKKDQDLLPTS